MQYENKNKAALLVKTVGVPGVCSPVCSPLKIEDFPAFLRLAEKNKIPLLFLRAVAPYLEYPSVSSTLLRYEERYQRTLDLIKFVADLLEQEKISYTIFKTMKPFPYVPSDVDVLLQSDEDLKTVVKTLTAEGCIVLDNDLYGVTMFSPAHEMNIDITIQVAVSGIVYVNKKLLFNHVSEVEFDGKTVRTLEPCVDLLVVTGHSVFKEQMYTLSDYYAFVMFPQHWAEASELADKFHLKHALETVLKVTKNITVNAFGSCNPLTESFDASGITYDSSKSKDFGIPKKYALSAVLVEFSKKIATDPITLSSLSSAFRSFCNPSFYLKLVEHATREKY